MIRPLDLPTRNHEDPEFLSLYGTPVRNIQALGRLAKLEELNLAYSAVDNVDSLTGLTALNDLNIVHTQITSIRKLSELKGLQELDMSGDHISKSQIEQFRKLRPNTRIRVSCMNPGSSAFGDDC